MHHLILPRPHPSPFPDEKLRLGEGKLGGRGATLSPVPGPGEHRSEILSQVRCGYCHVHTNLRTREDAASAWGASMSGCSSGRPQEFWKPQGRAGESLPCEVPSVFPTGLLFELSDSPLPSPLISGVQIASSRVKESPQKRAGQVLCHLIVLFLLKQMSQLQGYLLGGDCKEKGESKAFFPEDCPF